jgi:hypothetical protein
MALHTFTRIALRVERLREAEAFVIFCRFQHAPFTKAPTPGVHAPDGPERRSAALRTCWCVSFVGALREGRVGEFTALIL